LRLPPRRTLLIADASLSLRPQADICQLGMDQRKVNMLAREYCDATSPKIKFKPIILSHRECKCTCACELALAQAQAHAQAPPPPAVDEESN
jgi:hypothetical protein